MSNCAPLPTPALEHACDSLSAAHYAKVSAQPLKNPVLALQNTALAANLGLDSAIFSQAAGQDLFNGAAITDAPQIAYVYSGHQFGVWAGQLGDGRALSLGRLKVSPDNRQELQLKGAGMTPFSRMGDGRAALRSSLREYLCSEAMHALGIPSTRALCVYASEQLIMREAPEKSAVLTRVAPHFFRFGHFEHWYYQGRHQELRELADHCLKHYFQDCQNQASPYLAMLKRICITTGELIAKWQAYGFMHGVMNTDNMSIAGLTLDYGPYGFMDHFDPAHICNHSDHQGRYAFHAQPAIGDWNCHALGQCFTALHDDVDEIRQALAQYQTSFVSHYRTLLAEKFGLTLSSKDDDALLEDFFQLMASDAADYTLSFRALSHIPTRPGKADDNLFACFRNQPAIHDWLSHYRARLHYEKSDDSMRHASMQKRNPKYVLRNYLAEIAIQQAQQGDFSEAEKLSRILQNPYDEQAEVNDYASAPPAWASTLCVSCSS